MTNESNPESGDGCESSNGNEERRRITTSKLRNASIVKIYPFIIAPIIVC
jgi:hypothetical protein